jgi:hypothetical protein
MGGLPQIGIFWNPNAKPQAAEILLHPATALSQA